jgi:signal transduction histidine kinase
MSASTDDVRSALGQLADALLDDVERIAERSVARMRELLPSMAKLPADELLAVTLTNTRNLLEAVRDPDANLSRAEDHFRVSGETRITQGITADKLLQGWRIGLEVVREEAHPIASQLGIADDALLEFVEATMQWGGTLFSAACAEVSRLADEQAALRHLATLVAQDVSSDELFDAVAGGVGPLFGADYTGIIRYEPDPTFVTTMATWAAVGEHPPAPTRFGTVPGDPTAMVADTGKPARVDDWANVPGPIAEFVRLQLGVKSSVGSPIVVNGSLWGALALHSKRGPLAPDTESRLLDFSELVAAAVANARARAEVSRLGEEQAALRRVATLVAEGESPSVVLDSVAVETERALGADGTMLLRYQPDEEVMVVARHFPGAVALPVGTRVSHKGHNVSSMVWRSGRPARIEDYEQARGPLADAARGGEWKAIVGAPIIVDGRLWGVTVAIWRGEGSPSADTEERMAKFAELLGTAIANAEASAEVRRLADEQAALRRIAMLVAQDASPSAVLDAVAAEMQRLLRADAVTVGRYEAGEEMTVVAHRSPEPSLLTIGTRVNHEGKNVTAMVRRTGQPARLEDLGQADGGFAQLFRGLGMRQVVGAPIVVGGRPWGTILGSWRREEPPPADTEERMAQFAELLDTAIANADSRDQLTASRARLLTEADEARRRVVRDLHDGAQQRLVHTIITLKLAQRALEANDVNADSLIAEALQHAQQGNAELRELAHGLLPSVLTQGGLLAGVNAIVSRVDLPVEVDVPAERFPEEIEASAYFVVAGALTNVLKHSHAEHVEVTACVEDGMLRVEVRDDGVGGANPRGHGLVGLSDRVTALEGRLSIESPPRGGTILAATLPLNSK